MPGEPLMPHRLLQEQVRLLARNVPALVVGTLMAATGTTALLVFSGQPMFRAVAWLGAMAALCGLRWWVVKAYHREPERRDTRQWARWFVLSSMLAGALWGALVIFTFDAEDSHTLAVVAIMVAGMVASATQSLGPYFPAHLGFALPALLPIALRCLFGGTERELMLGLLTLAFLLMAEIFARRVAQSIAEATLLRFENESLAKALALERDRAEVAGLAKARFLATASHDLRQPIHAMALYVPALQALAERPRASLDPATLRVIAERMNAALTSVDQLLSRLLDVSRLDAGAVEVTRTELSLGELFDNCIDQVRVAAKAKGLGLRIRGKHLAVRTDAAILHTILGNLLSNAVRYTERGGVLLAARRRGDSVLIQVWDTGIGIAEDEQQRITDEFFQASNAHADASQARGFGLGLAIVRRSAQLLNTRLTWRSALGCGSVFAFSLPLAHGEPAPSMTPRHTTVSSPPPLAGAGPAILVVDEDDDILASMSFLLRTWGYTALTARTLSETREVASLRAGDIAAALIDFHLAPKENGLAVAVALRQHTRPDLPIAIVTGDTTPEVMAAVRGARLTLLHKPTAAEAVEAFLADALTGR